MAPPAPPRTLLIACGALAREVLALIELNGWDHITVAWGRDFSDVSPVKGVYLGGGSHTLLVSVDVAVLNESG